MRVYIFGNGNLDFEAFREHYVAPLEALDLASCEFLVGDFRGTDTLAMEWLKTRSAAVTVFHIGEAPRYLPDRFRTQVDNWTLRGEFADDASRDSAAIQACSHFVASDFNSTAERKSGTLRNIERCLVFGKTRLLP